jgi:DNA repair protein RecO (recombination protein O)
MVVPERGKSELHHIREARAAYIYHSIPTDISKSSILIFLNELLYKSIREETAHPEVFRYIFDQMVYLDGVDHLPACFHLLFALQLTRFLGFFPQLKPDRPTDVFDLQEGQFTRPGEMNPQYIISGPECSTFAKLLTLEPQEHPDFIIPAPVRNSLLEKILLYYTLHLPITGEFKSHLVLHEVLKK